MMDPPLVRVTARVAPRHPLRPWQPPATDLLEGVGVVVEVVGGTKPMVLTASTLVAEAVDVVGGRLLGAAPALGVAVLEPAAVGQASSSYRLLASPGVHLSTNTTGLRLFGRSAQLVGRAANACVWVSTTDAVPLGAPLLHDDVVIGIVVETSSASSPNLHRVALAHEAGLAMARIVAAFEGVAVCDSGVDWNCVFGRHGGTQGVRVLAVHRAVQRKGYLQPGDDLVALARAVDDVPHAVGADGYVDGWADDPTALHLAHVLDRLRIDYLPGDDARVAARSEDVVLHVVRRDDDGRRVVLRLTASLRPPQDALRARCAGLEPLEYVLRGGVGVRVLDEAVLAALGERGRVGDGHEWHLYSRLVVTYVADDGGGWEEEGASEGGALRVGALVDRLNGVEVTTLRDYALAWDASDLIRLELDGGRVATTRRLAHAKEEGETLPEQVGSVVR